MINDANIRVNRDTCIACGQCVDRCIMDNLRLSVAPCRQACPLGTNCQGYIRLTAMGKAREAAEELRKQTMFGRILGRVCTHPCESSCTRATEVQDGAVHIRAIKRYLADKFPDVTDAPPQPAEKTGKRVAVVGSGPAGLEAAMRLAEAGHSVTVFERDAKPGGTLRYGVPSFRLPEAELDRCIAALEHGGVAFACNRSIGTIAELAKDYEAVIVAGGTPESIPFNAPGADLPGVWKGFDFLRKVHVGENPVAGKKVLVIGGGATALDAAMCSKRLGAADVGMVCLEPYREMPVSEEKFVEMEDENLAVHQRLAVSSIAEHSGGLRLILQRCLSIFDEQGRFAPELDSASSIPDMEADLVILCIGQGPDQSTLKDLERGRRGVFAMDEFTRLAPGKGNVFIAGDCASGPRSVVEAMASGKEAAISANRLLAGEPLESARDVYALNGWSKEYLTRAENAVNGPRGEESAMPVARRDLNKETALAFSDEQALKEAGRCLACGRSFEMKHTCWFCLPCEIECPQDALEVRIPYLSR